MDVDAREEARSPVVVVKGGARGVEGLSLRPPHAADAAAARPPELAIVSSAHGGNIWDGELALVTLPSAATAAASASPPLVVAPQQNSITAVAWADAARLCVASDGGDVAVYELSDAAPRSLRAVASLDYHDDVVSAVAAVPGSSGHLVAASWDGS